MGASASKRKVHSTTFNSNKRMERTYIRNGVPPIRVGNGIQADGRSVYSDKPKKRTYNIPARKNSQYL